AEGPPRRLGVQPRRTGRGRPRPRGWQGLHEVERRQVRLPLAERAPALLRAGRCRVHRGGRGGLAVRPKAGRRLRNPDQLDPFHLGAEVALRPRPMPICFLLLAFVGAAPVPAAVPEGTARPLAEVVQAARKARASGDWDNARRLYLEALRQDPRSGVIALELGETCLDAGDPAVAEPALSRLAAAAPDRPAPRRALARALLAQGRPQPALEQARAAAALDPKNVDGMTLLGFTLVATREPEDAVAVFRSALARRPRDRDARGGLAMAYSALSDPRATKLFEAVLAEKPEPRYYWQYAEYLWRSRDVDRGNAQMEKALEVSRGDGVLLEAYGMQLFEQARFPDAVRRLKDARRAGRDDYDLIYTLGSAELENSNFEEAERILREAIAAAPDRPVARHRLGVVLILAGKPEEARQELLRAVETDPSGAVRLDLARAE